MLGRLSHQSSAGICCITLVNRASIELLLEWENIHKIWLYSNLLNKLSNATKIVSGMILKSQDIYDRSRLVRVKTTELALLVHVIDYHSLSSNSTRYTHPRKTWNKQVFAVSINYNSFAQILMPTSRIKSTRKTKNDRNESKDDCTGMGRWPAWRGKGTVFLLYATQNI
jgi:hypothetical protein